jgi:hypothetical protein
MPQLSAIMKEKGELSDVAMDGLGIPISTTKDGKVVNQRRVCLLNHKEFVLTETQTRVEKAIKKTVAKEKSAARKRKIATETNNINNSNNINTTIINDNNMNKKVKKIKLSMSSVI